MLSRWLLLLTSSEEAGGPLAACWPPLSKSRRSHLHSATRTPKPQSQADKTSKDVAFPCRVSSAPTLTGYLAALAQSLARNSDAQMPIIVTVIGSDDVNACTSPLGINTLPEDFYCRWSEGELSAVFAHGISHTVLRSPTIQALRQLMLPTASVPSQNLLFT
jgi:predicted Zn-dependent protease